MARPDYSRARWYGAFGGNYSAANRPNSTPINKIILHITEGSWSSAINWFNDSRSGVSAHYTVRSSDGFIGQSVEEKDIAYHAGNWPVNQTSIGIEHEGFGNDPKWLTDALYNASAQMSAYLCSKYRIPIQQASSASGSGFLFHRQVTSTACPGQFFNINTYLNLVRQYSGGDDGGGDDGGSGGSYSAIVDNTTSGRFSASSNWGTSAFSSQRYGTNYRFVNPAAVSDVARYRFNLPRQANYTVLAWWPAVSGYNTRTPYMINTTSGWRTVYVNQTQNGGRWVRLGTFNMAAGDNWNVQISRWTSTQGYVIADAVRVVEA